MLDNAFLLFFYINQSEGEPMVRLNKKPKETYFLVHVFFIKYIFCAVLRWISLFVRLYWVLCGKKTSAPAAEWTRHSRHWTVIRRGRIRYEEFWVFSKAFISLFFAKKKLNKGLHVIKASFPDGHSNNGRSSTLIDPK